MPEFERGDRVRVLRNTDHAILEGFTGTVAAQRVQSPIGLVVSVDLDRDPTEVSNWDRYGWGFRPEALEHVDKIARLLDWTGYRVLG